MMCSQVKKSSLRNRTLDDLHRWTPCVNTDVCKWPVYNAHLFLAVKTRGGR